MAPPQTSAWVDVVEEVIRSSSLMGLLKMFTSGISMGAAAGVLPASPERAQKWIQWADKVDSTPVMTTLLMGESLFKQRKYSEAKRSLLEAEALLVDLGAPISDEALDRVRFLLGEIDKRGGIDKSRA